MMLFLAIPFLGAIVLGILFLIPSFTFSIKDKQGHDVSQSIASLEKVNLGGQEQWILIRGMDITKSIILFFHNILIKYLLANKMTILAAINKIH